MLECKYPIIRVQMLGLRVGVTLLLKSRLVLELWTFLVCKYPRIQTQVTRLELGIVLEGKFSSVVIQVLMVSVTDSVGVQDKCVGIRVSFKVRTRDSVGTQVQGCKDEGEVIFRDRVRVRNSV